MADEHRSGRRPATTAVIVVPMPVSLGIAGRAFDHRFVRHADRDVDRVARSRPRRAAPRSRSTTRPRRRVAAHAVGDREQHESLVDDVGVLVVVARADLTSENAPAENFIGRTSSTGLEHGLADLHAVALADLHALVRRLLAVQERAVGGTEILEPQRAVVARRRARAPATRRCRKERDRAAAAAPDRRLAVDPVVAAAFGVGLPRRRRATALRAASGRGRRRPPLPAPACRAVRGPPPTRPERGTSTTARAGRT